MREPVTNEELGEWAKLRADDAGHLARELVVARPLIRELVAALAPFAKLFLDTTKINGVSCKDYEDLRSFVAVDPISYADFNMLNVREARAALAKAKAQGYEP